MSAPRTLSEPVTTEAPEADLPWRDNAFLAFWSVIDDVQGVVHVSTSPNAEGRRARASLTVRGATREVVEPLDPGTFRSASINFDLAGRVTVDHPDLGLDLALTARHAVADYSDTDLIPALVPGKPLRHLQQSAVVVGKARVRDRGVDHEADFEGVALRDRTWGFRDETAAFAEYLAVMLDLGDGFVTAIKFLSNDGDTTMHGFHLAEEATPVDALHVTRDAAGLVVGVEVGLPGREILELRRTQARGGFWVPMGIERRGPTFSAYDEFLTYDGGAGVIEQGIRRNLW